MYEMRCQSRFNARYWMLEFRKNIQKEKFPVETMGHANIYKLEQKEGNEKTGKE